MTAINIFYLVTGAAIGFAACFLLLAWVDARRVKRQSSVSNPYAGMAQGNYTGATGRDKDREPTELDQ